MATDVPDMPELEFWFEFASTYSYLSALRIDEMAAQAGVRVVWRPFLLGPIFGAQGWNTSPFTIYPEKGRYMWRDMERIADDRGLPFKRPALFPQHTILAARVALVALDDKRGQDFAKDLFRANFERGEDLSDTTVLARSLVSVGLKDSLLAQAVEDQNKARLRAQTERAQSKGIFGAPAFTCADELFWGDDRLEQALDYAQRARAPQ